MKINQLIKSIDEKIDKMRKISIKLERDGLFTDESLNELGIIMAKMNTYEEIKNMIETNLTLENNRKMIIETINNGK